MEDVKPGLKSSEFGVTLAGSVLGVLVMSGQLTADTANSLQPGVELIIGGLITLGLGMAYIVKRTDLKKAALELSKQPSGTYTVSTTPVENVVFPLPETQPAA